jgi:RNA polymerase sigma-70 factor (ECF subfamily)
MSLPHKENPIELIADARDGTDESLGRLLLLYTNYLKFLATTHIDPRIRARVSPSDIVQETFCEAHRDFGQFRGQSEPEFLAWLRRILVNNLAQQVERHLLTQKRDVRREVKLDEMGASMERSTMRLGAILVDRGDSPSGDAARSERAVILVDALAQLPADYRDVLVLRHVQSLPFDEIGRRMERSSGAARMLWLRAIEQLRPLLET